MTKNKLSISDPALEYLVKFCSERNDGRSGKLHWDSFLVDTLSAPAAPEAADLYSWLQENLTDAEPIETLVDDYQRVARLLDRSRQLTKLRLVNNVQNGLYELPNEFKAPLTAGGLPLGFHPGAAAKDKPTECTLSADMRNANPHILVIGRKQTGKSRLLARMALSDIESGDRAVIVVDSDGRLSGLIRQQIATHTRASELTRRLIVLDSAGDDRFFFNPLKIHDDDHNWHGTAGSIVPAFKTSFREPIGARIHWNQQTANILRNCVLLLMANERTLADLPTLMLDNDFRDLLLEAVERKKAERVEFIPLLETWHQYKRLARTDQWVTWVEPILTSLGPLLSDPFTRDVLSQGKNGLDLKTLIKDKKIMVFRTNRDHQNLLGGILINGLRHASTSLTQQNSTMAKVSIYVDQMDRFMDSDTIQALTQETRDSQLGLIGAVRSLASFPEDLLSRTIGDFGTIVAFGLDERDARVLAAKCFPLDPRRFARGVRVPDQERLNVDKLIRQESNTFFVNRADTLSGAFKLKAPD